MKRFRWAGKFDDRGISVSRVVAELDRIKKAEGRATEAAVVEAARPQISALHRFFEWDDTRAAAAHRESQARRLVTAVVVVYDPESPVHDEVVERSYSIEYFAPEKSAAATGPAPTMPRPAAIPFVERGPALKVDRGWDELLKWLATYGEIDEFGPIRAVIARVREKQSCVA